MKTTAVVVAVATAALLAPESVNAHGFISEPKATYMSGSSYTSYSAEFTASINKGFSGGIYNRSPEQNVAAFTAAWPKTGYKSLKEMMDTQVPGCGFTNPNAAPVDVSNLKSMKYQNNEYKEGFLGSHHGPCEIWIDNTKIMHGDDCVKSYPGYPATIPVDYSVCKGTCRLTFYWLAVHSQKWQAYSTLQRRATSMSCCLLCIACETCCCCCWNITIADSNLYCDVLRVCPSQRAVWRSRTAAATRRAAWTRTPTTRTT